MPLAIFRISPGALANDDGKRHRVAGLGRAGHNGARQRYE